VRMKSTMPIICHSIPDQEAAVTHEKVLAGSRRSERDQDSRVLQAAREAAPGLLTVCDQPVQKSQAGGYAGYGLPVFPAKRGCRARLVA
jgi:hypothetical protein